jgi:hypothetical protein
MIRGLNGYARVVFHMWCDARTANIFMVRL